MNIGEVCSRVVCIIGKSDSLAEAAREMKERHVGALVVVEWQGDRVQPVGIVTDRDIVCGQVARAADLFSLNVGDVMTPDPLTICEASGLSEAIERMSARAVRRAPVVNHCGDLVGLVSLDDLLPVVAEELGGLARLVGGQAKRESPGSHPVAQEPRNNRSPVLWQMLFGD